VSTDSPPTNTARKFRFSKISDLSERFSEVFRIARKGFQISQKKFCKFDRKKFSELSGKSLSLVEFLLSHLDLLKK
jgi:hypothetical protein